MCGSGLIGAKVGIVGMGRIGLAVAKRLVPFEVDKIMYTGSGAKLEGINSSIDLNPTRDFIIYFSFDF